ncbi:hypothetical protein Ctob_015905 [Chrysochromulina tobinii]|uniref:Uncharacterized protein n=1 Tax=Chrysochromulina tobinii TaxID=1460289 RepID=A0A0M0LRG6_9EUKA|nr:hypothetical protein Ctob_015905 [Chrysochromulina tobinii]|eukprot:KOO53581.1 hypothetical protein Ctob_015905 [Chrysochromulina sp. CCMP291]
MQLDVWKPGDVVCRLDRTLRPARRVTFVALAGAGHCVLPALERVRAAIAAEVEREVGEFRRLREAEEARRLAEKRLAEVERKAAIAAASAIEPLVALVRDGDREGKAKAAAALGNLAGDDDANKAAIVAAGAIEPLAALMRDGDAEGKAKAAGALGNLAGGDDDAIVWAIAAAGAIEPLAALVRDGDAEGKAKAAGALRYVWPSRRPS